MSYHINLSCYLYSNYTLLPAIQIYDTVLNTQLWALSCSYLRNDVLELQLFTFGMANSVAQRMPTLLGIQQTSH